ncbi:uncharacterized protein E0L32_011400 [Thyridium curvatum]|uniref:FAD/NAD(P)-binding domain-containing protein n=1 Tax=Thyridium curvatum TaxID=1093900 RepID=A0A507B9C2_9PEZI|nr:uncharacterized protein E0L32_011400 [Thyridium curvatum]TPX18922.1 hypothetical protein E0L32_011400 [Thyridium curvatum]
MSKTVVILGGSYAGLHIAHALLKNEKDLKVVLVSKNSHFYWNIASVRAIIPGIIKDEELFGSIEKALSRYPKDRYEFIVGGATASDFAAKTVTVTTKDGAEKQLSYDHLVLATGARCAGAESVPWKAAGTYEEAVELLHATQERVKAAGHFVVAGAGSTGVEAAAELGFEYGKDREVVLLCSDREVLGGDSIASNALAELKKLNVKVRTEARVESAARLPDGKTEIKLAGGGDPIVTDVYLPTFGLAPNSEFVDAKYLTDKKYASIDAEYRVKGAENVWAAGDIVSQPRAGFMITQKQAAGVAKNIGLVASGKQPTPVKLLPFDIYAVATGRSRGAGRAGSVKLLSFMVYMAKGKTLAVERMAGYIDGSVA